jgi:flagellar biosynthesis protein FlhG
MSREPRVDDWRALGLEPGATLDEVHDAYTRRKALYSPDSLATYSLHDDDERERMLDDIESAYRRILDAERAAAAAGANSSDAVERPAADRPSGPAPPADERPGAHLRHHRLRHGITLEHLAQETKIRASLLELLESEAFEELPATVYVRGFVIQCGRSLGLPDPEAVASAYLAKMNRTE